VLIDDKLRILSAFKAAWGRDVTTIFPRQGAFANDSAALAANPPPDLAISRIGDLLATDLGARLPLQTSMVTT
jgi:hypothetical protein